MFYPNIGIFDELFSVLHEGLAGQEGAQHREE
jgi:hypothetical protein